jgi:hypothetical protein
MLAFDRVEKGGTMAVGAKDKDQLREAREQIRRQLMQLERAAADPYAQVGLGPDNRGVYAELQRELQEINELLGEDGGNRDSEGLETAAGAYHPLSADFNQGCQPMRNPIAIGMVAFSILWLLFLFVHAVVAG